VAEVTVSISLTGLSSFGKVTALTLGILILIWSGVSWIEVETY